MNDTDKKIEKIKTDCIERVLDCCYGDDKVLIHIEKTIQDVRRLYEDQLKECREALRDRERELRVREMNPAKLYPLVTRKEREAIKQRTKEACFEAGWKWIIAYFKGLPLSESNEYRQKSFKQAIDEAKIE